MPLPKIGYFGAVMVMVMAVTQEASSGPAYKGIRNDCRRVSSKPDSYFAPRATGPIGQDQPVSNIPGSVTVLPRSVLDDTQATTLGQALRSAAGVSGSSR
jgi:outer membrane receptor for monomeric catechols